LTGGSSAPIHTGSGTSSTPKASKTPSRTAAASATRSSLLAPPRLVSARVCLVDNPARSRPGTCQPLWKPARSISQAAENLNSGFSGVPTENSGMASASASPTRSRTAATTASRAASPATTGLVKKEPADQVSWSSALRTMPLPARSSSTASRTSAAGRPTPPARAGNAHAPGQLTVAQRQGEPRRIQLELHLQHRRTVGELQVRVAIRQVQALWRHPLRDPAGAVVEAHPAQHQGYLRPVGAN